MTTDLNSALARTLVDEWARAGVTHACLSPGSRSAPLAYALAAEPGIRLHVLLDERSASFFALGTARATGRPAVVVSTSGTAAAELHPAVLEASYGRVPLICCTADRPSELLDTGAGQTVDQVKLYGGAVRWYTALGAVDGRPEATAAWRPLAARSVAEAIGPPAGPVHLNLTFPEPLVPTEGEAAIPEGRADGRPWVESRPGLLRADSRDVSWLAGMVAAHRRGLLVAGWGAGLDPLVAEQFAAAAGWPVLADPLSGLRGGPQAVSAYEALLAAPGFAGAYRPDLVVRVGAGLTSRVATEWLDASVPQIVVDPDRARLDPRRTAAWRIEADPAALLAATADLVTDPGGGPSDWLGEWMGAEAAARAAMDHLLDQWGEPFEGRVARDLVAGLPDGATLVVGSSMPVRDVEAFAPPRRGLSVVANRGVNGIDGFVSTALGVAAASAEGPSGPAEREIQGGPVVALCGDLTFLHDVGGLWAATHDQLDAVLVVVDNDGGGVFSFLPQAGYGRDFERLFGTPHGLDLVAVARAHGVRTSEVTEAGDLVPGVDKALGEGGAHVIVVRTDRADNVVRHRHVWEAVATALAGT